MELIAVVAVLTLAYTLVKKLRGPLPTDRKPTFGGAPYDEESKSNPNAE